MPADLADPATVYERFARVAERQGDAAAVEDASRSVAYGALHRWAEHVSDQLADHGVGTGDRVAVVVDREAGLLAALLAVMRRGAAFVAIDPRRSAVRGRQIVAGAGVRVALMGSEPSECIPRETPVVAMAQEPSLAVAARSVCLAEAGAPAYIAFTSGSTGRPKVVVCTHAECHLRRRAHRGDRPVRRRSRPRDHIRRL